MPENPLLLNGFESGWIQKFFLEPFDPLCVMLAMRTKLLLDAIDEMGKSYNLLRKINFGWIDFGPIPGEEPGNPDDYYPPATNNPIIITPPPTEPGVPVVTYRWPLPGVPGYIPPGPGQPGYIPPGPGQPGYVPPGGVTPGGGAPGGAPGGGAPGRGGAPGGLGPGGGAPGGGPGGGIPQYPTGPGGGTSYASLSSPWGFGYPNDQGGPPGGGKSFGKGWDCCFDEDDPTHYVSIGYNTLDMDPGEIQGLVINGVKYGCSPDNFTWEAEPEGGSLNVSNPLGPVFTASAGGPDCVSPCTITLFCKGKEMGSIEMGILSVPPSASIDYTTNQMAINDQQTLTAIPEGSFCGELECEWAIISGGGSLSSGTGVSVVYTAPATNPQCANNPTITLQCSDEVQDTIEIAVNATAGSSVIISCCSVPYHPPHPSNMRCTNFQSCNGNWNYPTDSFCVEHCGGAFGAYAPPGTTGFNLCSVMGWAEGFTDERTESQKAAGCCPSALL